jgi:FMN phosphatase YigB (HAD superfamily)
VHIASDFRVPAASILHIGDRAETDAAAARAAGCRCLILGRDFRDFGSLLQQFRLAL